MRELIQCGWAHPKNTFFIRYHNEEGASRFTTIKLFEKLVLESL